MKQLRISIPQDKLSIVRELEERFNINFEVIIYEGDVILISVVENNQTAVLLEELKGIGVGTVFGNIIVSPVDIEVTSKIKKHAGNARFIKGRGISLDEMIASIRGLGIISPTFVILTILAGLLSSFGLWYDNVVIIIASMIIAPFLGPIALTVIGTMLPKNPYRFKALITELFGLFSCMFIGVLVSLIMKNYAPLPENLNSQIMNRAKLNLGDIIFAVVSGMAAGVFLVRGESTSLVGVAVAASLCPPAANIGILLVIDVNLALGSLMLLVLNVISIYSACAVIFWISQSLVRGGTMSSRQYKRISKRYYAQTIIISVILLCVILIILAYFGA
ncbi:MAG: TIGR00341 family protein [Promethearchaeota archaeon]